MRLFGWFHRKIKDEDLMFLPRDEIVLHAPTQIIETDEFKRAQKFGPEANTYTGPEPDSEEGIAASSTVNQQVLSRLEEQVAATERDEQSRMKPGQVVVGRYR